MFKKRTSDTRTALFLENALGTGAEILLQRASNKSQDGPRANQRPAQVNLWTKYCRNCQYRCAINEEVSLCTSILGNSWYWISCWHWCCYVRLSGSLSVHVYSSWNVMAHGDAREGNWRRNWRMEWVACTLHTISEHGVSNITTADAHTSAASSRLNWRPPPI